MSTARTRAEEQFARLTRQDAAAVKRDAPPPKLEKIDRLRALRLAKEAAEKEAALQRAAEKAAGKVSKTPR